MISHRRRVLTPRKGFSLLMMLAMAAVLFPVVGLSIDVGIMYVVKTKLSAAADAAVLAGARSLNVGTSISAQSDNATAVTQDYFNANFPSGYMLSTSSSISTTVTQTSVFLRTVATTATATVPTIFLRYLPAVPATVTMNVSAAAQRRNTNLVLVLDRSNSLNLSSSCAPMITAAANFATLFAEQEDTLGLVTFATSSYNGFTTNGATYSVFNPSPAGFTIDYPLTTSFKSQTPSLATTIGNVVCTGGTSSAMGLYNAYKALAAINQPGALNVIIFFTDGQPTAFTQAFDLAPASPCYGHVPAQAGLTLANQVMGVLTVGFNGTTPTGNWGLLNPSVSGVPLSPVNSAGNVSGMSPTPTEDQVVAPPGGNSHLCTFNGSFNGGSGTSQPTNVVSDLAHIRTTDVYGNSLTSSPLAGYAPGTTGGFISMTPGDIFNASIEAAVNMSWRIIQGNAIAGVPTALPGVVIFTIGLGNATIPPHTDFLECVANDARSSCYNSSYTPGQYFPSPTASDLQSVFVQVAGQVLRLSQ